MNVLIADDEPLVREALRTHLAAIAPDALAAEAADGLAALEAMRASAPDIVFLDVRMPGLDGFQVLESLDAGALPIVVFVTAYDEYALRAFEASAVDYLLKPFDEDRVRRAWIRALTMYRGKNATTSGASDRNAANERLLDAIRQLRARPEDERLALRLGNRTVLVPIDEIDYAVGERNYVQVFTAGRGMLLRETMRSLAARLEKYGFVRIHRSAVVNFPRIREVRSNGPEKWQVILKDGTRLPVSESGRRAIDERLRV